MSRDYFHLYVQLFDEIDKLRLLLFNAITCGRKLQKNAINLNSKC